MEHRIAPRLRALLQARIVFNNGMSTMDCLIRDLSEGGAKLQMSDSIALPDRFDLYIVKKDETRRARLQWRAGDEIGVAFEQAATAAQPAAASKDVAQRLADLETETAQLRRLLEEMRGELRQARIEGLKSAG